MFPSNSAGLTPLAALGPVEFSFLDPGELIDGELGLVAPEERWINDVLCACHHPMTRASDPEHGQMTRYRLERMLEANPKGHERAYPPGETVPSYNFWMRLRPEFSPLVPMAGSIGLRVGGTADIEFYFGHIGYNVYPPARGSHYAERACRLLLPLARAHGLNPLWITTDPENFPSRRTCERLSARYVDTVHVPTDHVLYARGQRLKCRYRLDL